MTDKIASYDREVRELIASAKAARERKRPAESDDEDDEEGHGGQASHPEAAEEGDDDDDDSFSDTSNDEFEDRFVDLEEDLANVIADVHDLGESVERSPVRRGRFLMIKVNGTICRPLLSLELHRFCQDCQKARRESPVDVFSRSRLIHDADAHRNGPASPSKVSSCATFSRSGHSTSSRTTRSSCSCLGSTTSCGREARR